MSVSSSASAMEKAQAPLHSQTTNLKQMDFIGAFPPTGKGLCYKQTNRCDLLSPLPSCFFSGFPVWVTPKRSSSYGLKAVHRKPLSPDIPNHRMDVTHLR